MRDNPVTRCPMCFVLKTNTEGDTVQRIVSGFLTTPQFNDIDAGMDSGNPRDLCPRCLIDMMAALV